MNNLRRNLAKFASVACLMLCLTSCAVHLFRTFFEVIPNSPNYLLRSPDSRQTAFPDVLKAYNGFEQGHKWIDLEPLMELRIENAYYEPGFRRSGLTGFLGTEVGRFGVTAHGLSLASVQSMPNRPIADIPVQSLISNEQTKFKLHRLFYEIVFARHDQSHGSVLLSAQSRAEIDGLSAQLANPEAVCFDRSVHCTVFPDACSVSIEMKVMVNGEAKSVLWGSSLGSVAKQPSRLEMKRVYGHELRRVRIDEKDPKALLLPLLPGDQIVWN